MGMDLVVSVHGVVRVLELAHRREGRGLKGYLGDGCLFLGLLSFALCLLIPFVWVGMGDAEGTFGLRVLVGSGAFASGRHRERRGTEEEACSDVENWLRNRGEDVGAMRQMVVTDGWEQEETERRGEEKMRG